MRRQDAVRQAPERMRGRQRLRVRHIKACAEQVAALQLPCQRIGIKKAAAPDVHNDGVLRKQSKALRAEPPGRLRRLRHRAQDEVRRGQQGLCLVQPDKAVKAGAIRRGPAADAERLHTKGLQAAGNAPAQIARAEDEGRSPCHAALGAEIVPVPLPRIGGQAAAQGQQHPDRMLRDRFAERAGGRCEQHTAREAAMQIAVCARPCHLQPAQLRRVLQGLERRLADDGLGRLQAGRFLHGEPAGRCFQKPIRSKRGVLRFDHQFTHRCPPAGRPEPAHGTVRAAAFPSDPAWKRPASSC